MLSPLRYNSRHQREAGLVDEPDPVNVAEQV